MVSHCLCVCLRVYVRVRVIRWKSEPWTTHLPEPGGLNTKPAYFNKYERILNTYK